MTKQNTNPPATGDKTSSQRLYTEGEVAQMLRGIQQSMQASREILSRIVTNLEASNARFEARMEAELSKPWWIRFLLGRDTPKLPMGRARYG